MPFNKYNSPKQSKNAGQKFINRLKKLQHKLTRMEKNFRSAQIQGGGNLRSMDIISKYVPRQNLSSKS